MKRTSPITRAPSPFPAPTFGRARSRKWLHRGAAVHGSRRARCARAVWHSAYRHADDASPHLVGDQKVAATELNMQNRQISQSSSTPSISHVNVATGLPYDRLIEAFE